MDDDFRTPEAVAGLFDLARAINRERAAGTNAEAVEPARAKLAELAGVLGLQLEPSEDATSGDVAPFVDLLLRVRQELRTAKQWALSDLIRDGLADLDIVVEDTPQGATWSRKRT